MIGGCASERWVQAPGATWGPDCSRAYRVQELLVIAFQARDWQEVKGVLLKALVCLSVCVSVSVKWDWMIQEKDKTTDSHCTRPDLGQKLLWVPAIVYSRTGPPKINFVGWINLSDYFQTNCCADLKPSLGKKFETSHPSGPVGKFPRKTHVFLFFSFFVWSSKSNATERLSRNNKAHSLQRLSSCKLCAIETSCCFTSVPRCMETRSWHLWNFCRWHT